MRLRWPLGVSSIAGDGEQDDEVRPRGAGDEMLAAVDDVVAAILRRRGSGCPWRPNRHWARSSRRLPCARRGSTATDRLSRWSSRQALRISDGRPTQPAQPPGRFAHLAVHQRDRDDSRDRRHPLPPACWRRRGPSPSSASGSACPVPAAPRPGARPRAHGERFPSAMNWRIVSMSMVCSSLGEKSKAMITSP